MLARKPKKPADESDTTALFAALADLTGRQVELGREIATRQDEFRRTQEAIAALKAVIASTLTGRVLLAAMEHGTAVVRVAPARQASGGPVERARQLVEQLAPSLAPKGPVGVVDVQLRPGSLPYAAREILLADGAPMQADAIVERMRLAGQKAQRDSLVTALARLAADHRVFFRVEGEPNKFGLVEWLRDREPKQSRASRPRKKRK